MIKSKQIIFQNRKSTARPKSEKPVFPFDSLLKLGLQVGLFFINVEMFSGEQILSISVNKQENFLPDVLGKLWNYVVEYTFNYRLTPNLSEGDGLQHSPLKRGMSDGTLTGVEEPTAARCALKYINP